MTMRFCKDCAFFHKDWRFGPALCRYGARQTYNPVDGRAIKPVLPFCEIERLKESLLGPKRCGPEGRYWALRDGDAS